MMRFMTTASKKRNKISLSFRILGNLWSTWRKAGGAQRRHNKWCDKTFGFVFIISRICRRYDTLKWCFPTRVVKAKRDYAQGEKKCKSRKCLFAYKKVGTLHAEWRLLLHCRFLPFTRTYLKRTPALNFECRLNFVQFLCSPVRAYWSFPKV